MPPKTVSLARSHLSFTLIHYLTNAKEKKYFAVYNPDSIPFEKIFYAKHIMYSIVTVHFEVKITV